MGEKDDPKDSGLPLSETMQLSVPPPRRVQSVIEANPFDEDSMVYVPSLEQLDSIITAPPMRTLALGETLQFVKFQRRGDTLMISGLTPHGRRLTFEQREDREGWYVVVAGRRRRPTRRELGLVVASITQEMEAASAPEGDAEVRSAYRLAASSDQPGVEIRGLQAYRDLLLDEAAAYISGQIGRLSVVAVEYQAFKRFAIRHGHRIGAAFVRALGERLSGLFGGMEKIHVCHKAGKSFRVIVVDRDTAEVDEVINLITSSATRQWLVERVWGRDQRTHPDEVNFYLGIAMARSRERRASNYEMLAQRLNDDAYRAAKLGQLKGHTSIQVAKNDYRTTIDRWRRSSEDELEELAGQMDDGPAEVMAEMADYLHELVPADLDGMAVEGDVHALIHKAIARDGFWQGTTAMRIAGERLLQRFMGRESTPPGQNDYVGGFDLGDEFYGAGIDRDRFYFAWGDLNSAGATRVRAGLEAIQQAVGWKRKDGAGILGGFLRAIRGEADERPIVERVIEAADESYVTLSKVESLLVNDAVDIADYLWTPEGELIKNEDLVEGAVLKLSLPGRQRTVKVLERRASFIVRFDIEGVEHLASVNESFTGPYVKLRIRDTVISAAVCIIEMRRHELMEMLDIVREDNGLSDDHPFDVIGFLRHIDDILLADQVKGPAKIEMALGTPYAAKNFVKLYTLEDVRERHPGLYYEAVHHSLLQDHSLGIDRHLSDMIVNTMLAQTRPVERE